MARTTNVAEHAVRRDTFIDATLRLLQSKVYEEMSIQDVLDEVGASRGAFYHYFDSKTALLEAVLERMIVQATASLRPIVADPDLSAADKLSGAFGGIAAWKLARRELLLAVMRVWLSDENAIVRDKLRTGTARNLTPLFAEIIGQGVAEGSFAISSSPADAARVFVSLILGANEAATQLALAHEADTISFEELQRALAAYGDAFERILGARPGSLTFVDESVLREWFG
jgi:AcrR family transcriptional regulator